VWNYFGKYPAVVLNKQNIVVCKLCREECNRSETTSSKWEGNYGASKSTSKLNNHLQSKHKNVAIQLAVESANDHATKHNDGQQTLDTHLRRSKTEKQRELYLRWVVESFKPLGECNNPFFREYIESLDPKVKHEDRHSVSSRLVMKAHDVRMSIKMMIDKKK
jgi:hypothetical protein